MKSKRNFGEVREIKRTASIRFWLVFIGILAGNGNFVEAKHRKDTHKDEIRHDLKLHRLRTTMAN